MNWDSRFLILSNNYITTTNQHSINIHRNVVPPGQLPGQMMRPGGPPGGPPGGGPQAPTSQPRTSARRVRARRRNLILAKQKHRWTKRGPCLVAPQTSMEYVSPSIWSCFGMKCSTLSYAFMSTHHLAEQQKGKKSAMLRRAFVFVGQELRGRHCNLENWR